jgi:hypothetical protein
MPYNIPFKNTSSDTIPGFAVMRCTGSMNLSDQLVLTMDQPNDDFQRLYYLNGPVAVAAGQFGNCSDALGGPGGRELHYALFNADSTSDYDQPAFDQQWGPVPGEWYLERGRYGFTVIGPYINEGTVVDQTITIDSTPNRTQTVVDSESSGQADDGEDEDGNGGDGSGVEDTSDHSMDRVVVRQELVANAHGLIQTALRNDADISGSDHTTSIADVAVYFCKTTLTSDPVTYTETSTGQSIRNAKPYCLAASANVKSGDQVVCAFMGGQWHVTQTLSCPPSIS